MGPLTSIAFDRNGPCGRGLSTIDESPDDLPLTPGSGVRVQSGDAYFTDDTGKCIAGIWDCTPCQTAMGPYPFDEFMVLIDGSVIIIREDGTERIFRAGDAFVIPKGSIVSWKQTESVRKFYVVVIDDKIEAGSSETLMVRHIDPTKDIPNSRGVYTDPSGQFRAGIKDGKFISSSPPFPENELLHILEGEITITTDASDGDGECDVRTFVAGDTFLVPRGMNCHRRSSTDGVLAIFCSWNPSPSK
ncbi:hypothetical protein ACHAXA_009285 [Cyclostephanos tholiformis]|jgi:uncharacterized cupin superfamily protein|uniref:(S)-ureidoglycine aminohydrolase cupin domain-containing protein n=1 Tax=Cyclostephanos tholiformis TaxID=382380 RepID=A0ABD3RE40_9STRA